MTLEPSHRLEFLPTTSFLSQFSRIYTTDRFSSVIGTRAGSIDVIQVPHDIKELPSLRSFPIDDVQVRSQSLQLELVVQVRHDYSMDFITYDLNGKINEVESQICIGPFPEVKFLRMVACDEASGRLILYRGPGDYVLLQV